MKLKVDKIKMMNKIRIFQSFWTHLHYDATL